MTRIFIATPAVKSGSSILSWLLSQHPAFAGRPILERMELGAMLNVLDWVPGWKEGDGRLGTGIGDAEMIEKIHGFTDSIINPNGGMYCGVKFTNFQAYRWLRYVFPGDKILVTVRNLHDWYGSIKGWNTRREGMWKRQSVDRWIIDGATSLVGVQEVGIVHLEDLISDPAKTMEAVHGYLGLDHHPIDLAGQESVFLSYSSVPDSMLPPIDQGTLIKSPIGRGNILGNEDRDHVTAVFNREINVRMLYSDSRRIR